jgi:hypothetical protein
VALSLSGQELERQRRIEYVSKLPGFAALWDFVAKKNQHFDAIQPRSSRFGFHLVPLNPVHEFWGEGRPATMEDFPLLGQGPFGQAIRIRPETDPTFRPTLIVPRSRLHNSAIDVKGPGQSVTLVAWIIRESGNHAIAGIWHEGTDLKERGGEAKRVEPGMRQYALFTGLAANNGASAAHVSENGGASFGDKYARNLSVTKQVITPRSNVDSDPNGEFDVIAMVFDNKKNTVTSFLNGVADEHWIENPLLHPFFQWPAKAWPHEYNPPKSFVKVENGKLAALKVNPYYFPHDLFTPPSIERGGPFTISRVIHSGRAVGSTGWIGAVAVFNRPLRPSQIKRLTELTRVPIKAAMPQ